MLRNIACIMLLLLAVGILVLPQFADARAGGGRSSGSRGSHTYSSTPGAQPINRSTTANQSHNQSASPAMAPPSTGGSFWRGLAGGFLGAGLFSMLFGGMGGMGGGMGGGGLGLLPIILIGLVVYWLYKKMKSGGFSSGGYGYNSSSGGYTSPALVTSQPIAITDADKYEFQQLLLHIQSAWSGGDMTQLRQMVTPEMLHYFSEELAANSSRGVANKIEKVQLQHADIAEAWHEYEMDYATARLQWTALDYTVRLDRQPQDPDYVESGGIAVPSVAEEFWTFTRTSGGRWVLSAIQQVG